MDLHLQIRIWSDLEKANLAQPYKLYTEHHFNAMYALTSLVSTVIAYTYWFCRYDHLRKEASDAKPIAKVDKVAEPWRAALETTFTEYVRNHYNKLGSATVYGSSTAEGNITLTACIESHQFSPKNFW